MITNLTNLPLSLAVWLADDDYDYNREDNYLSATSLLKPVKSLILGSRSLESEQDVDVTSLVASRMGTAIHTSIEQTWLSDRVKNIMQKLGHPKFLIESLKINPDPSTVTPDDLAIYMEIRNTKEIDGYTIGGKFDFICDGQLEDFKSTSTYTWINQSNRDKYIQQGSIYRWLNPHLVTQDSMRINYIFTDWSAAKAKQSKDYPPAKTLSQEYPLMSLADTELFIRTKLYELKKYAGLPEEDMPACTPEDLWEKPPVYKYYKNPEKKARSSGNFDTYWEANQKLIADGSVGEIVTVKGSVGFCKYCPALGLCKQAQTYIDEGRLSI